MTAIHQISAVQLAAAIRAKQISAVEAVTASVAQIDRLNPTLKAIMTLCRERAQAEAKAADQALAQGEIQGALHGVPFTVKDLTATARIRTTYGSLIYPDHVPQKDEICVARLRAAGGILIGKTNTPEFGMGAHCTNALYGPTSNPYDLDRSSGGSSGGAAVAVATGMGYLAQGTDMGGSCRTPASFCGVVGLRPAVGRIPRRRKPLLWDYLDTDGILARSVEDAALMLSVMAGADQRDPLSIGNVSWKLPNWSMLQPPLRVGFSLDLGTAVIDAEVEAVFRQAIEQVAPLCQRITEAHPDCARAQSAFETLRAATLRHKQKQHYQKYHHLLSESVRWNIERGDGVSAADLLQAEADRDQLYLNFLNFFEDFDILATVSSSVLPFPHTQAEILEINAKPLHSMIDYLKITYTISLTGLPAVSIPCGRTASGLPVGMQLVGKPQGEAALLQVAHRLQEELGWRHRWREEH
ncbi:MAG: amidase [Cyanobacteria bacterium RM1_2_2]|nr:amidase [Cyanobacteria bacterium RM1_2_2]